MLHVNMTVTEGFALHTSMMVISDSLFCRSTPNVFSQQLRMTPSTPATPTAPGLGTPASPHTKRLLIAPCTAFAQQEVQHIRDDNK